MERGEFMHKIVHSLSEHAALSRLRVHASRRQVNAVAAVQPRRIGTSREDHAVASDVARLALPTTASSWSVSDRGIECELGIDTDILRAGRRDGLMHATSVQHHVCSVIKSHGESESSDAEMDGED